LQILQPMGEGSAWPKGHTHKDSTRPNLLSLKAAHLINNSKSLQQRAVSSFCCSWLLQYHLWHLCGP
jgi:hypothetical protein